MLLSGFSKRVEEKIPQCTVAVDVLCQIALV